jgi:hypothetical protein
MFVKASVMLKYAETVIALGTTVVGVIVAFVYTFIASVSYPRKRLAEKKIFRNQVNNSQYLRTKSGGEI